MIEGVSPDLPYTDRLPAPKVWGLRLGRPLVRFGLRLSWRDRWLHVRPSGTEPIVRLIAEAPTTTDADALIGAARELLQ